MSAEYVGIAQGDLTEVCVSYVVHNQQHLVSVTHLQQHHCNNAILAHFWHVEPSYWRVVCA